MEKMKLQGEYRNMASVGMLPVCCQSTARADTSFRERIQIQVLENGEEKRKENRGRSMG
jgi:hypothetical protein